MANLAVATPQVITGLQRTLVMGRNFIVKQSPIILAGTAVAGVVTTCVLAVRAGIRASELIKEAENVKGESLSTKEKVVASWKAYIPPAISGALTIGSIIGSTTISQKRQTALAALSALSESALREYQEKVEAKYGPKDAQKIKDEINSDKVRSAGTPPWEEGTLPKGECLCYDRLTGRYFTSSVQQIKMAEATLMGNIARGDMCASLNELYALIDSPDLPCCTLGDEIGWSISHPCEIYFTSTLTSNMTLCLVMDFATGREPTYNYRDL